MSQPLPNGEFEWVEDLENIRLDDYLKDDGRGMVLEVDMEYPPELHDLHNGYPLAPESKEIDSSMLSDYARNIAEKFQLTIGGVRKLITSLGPRKKYVSHVRNLKLYTDLGMKLTRVHRAVTFKQSCWLKDYIDFNTKMRSTAKNTFEKNFFKLMNNSIYGKTMENLRKRVDVKLVSSEKDLLKMTTSPCFQSHRIMNENLIVVKRMREVLTLNKPCYVGMSILDLSKTLMYDFHYNTIKKEYGDTSRLLFTDTDSLMYELKTDDVYEDFERIGKEQDCWDNSDYPKDSPYYSDHNKKVIGKFKDEAGGVPIIEFVRLRSKMYSYVKENGKGGMTAKGVKKYVIRNKLTHENFKDVIGTKGRMRHNMNTIRSTKHTIGTYEMRKVTLSCFDDKRYLLEDGVTSYAYGNWRIAIKDVEVVIQEEVEPDVCKHRGVVENECVTVLKPVMIEKRPSALIVFEEEIVELKSPQIGKIEPYNMFLLKVIAFRKAERKLDSSDRVAQLMDFGWGIEKLSKYMAECDEKVLCEYTEDELEEHKNRLRGEDMEEDKIEEKISREIHTSKEKLTRKYEVYLGIREESVERPVKVYKRWLTDVRGNSDEEVDEMAEREFSGQPPKIEHQSTKPEEEPEPESEQEEEDENDRFIRRRWNPNERHRSKNKDSSRRHRKNRKTKRDRSKNRHSRRPAK
jgi:hypothetical protein